MLEDGTTIGRTIWCKRCGRPLGSTPRIPAPAGLPGTPARLREPAVGRGGASAGAGDRRRRQNPDRHAERRGRHRAVGHLAGQPVTPSAALPPHGGQQQAAARLLITAAQALLPDASAQASTRGPAAG